LFPGDKVPQDAQDFKDELKRIEQFVLNLQKEVILECQKFSEDIKQWAEYKTGVKEFKPWLENAEHKSTDGLSKPQTLDEANAMFISVKEFVSSCEKNLKILTEATTAANKMTTHKDADAEVEVLKGRYAKVKDVADEWFKKVETLVKEWMLLDSTVCELNSWVAEDRKEGEQQFSLEKMESTLGELKNIFKEKEKLVENL
jgi:uncharacterized coiled-coil protein SlyX